MSAAIKMARAGYQGDPGLFSFLGKVGRGVVGAATGFATGGISGGLRGAVSPFVSVGATTPPPRSYARPMALAMPPQTNGGGRIRIDPLAALPGGRPFITRDVAVDGKAPGGFHWNKSSYYTQSEGWIEKGTKLVKNRRRNPGNIKAASRSLSRVIATKNALSTFSKVTVRDPNAPKTKTVYKCMKCGHSKCRCD